MTESTSASRSRIWDELRGLVRGDVRCDELTLRLFSSDGSPYQELPLGVVWPRSRDDVAAVAQYAAEKGISLHFRGSGTGAVAGAIGSGIALDFSRFMRRTLAIGDDYIRVQPGAVRERTNGLLRSTYGRFFAPSSGHVPTGTFGGLLAVDNIGPRWTRYGSPSESAREIDVVLSDGTIHNYRAYNAPRSFFIQCRREGSSFRRRFLNASLAEANARAYVDDSIVFDRKFDEETIASVGASNAPDFGLDFQDGYGTRTFRSDLTRETFFRRAFGKDADVVRDIVSSEPWTSALRAIREVEPFIDDEQRVDAPLRCGLPFRDIFRNGFNPSRLFLGTEGALGAIVEAELSTFPTSRANCAAVLFFDSVDQAARAVPLVLEKEPTLCDLLDSRTITLARDWDSRFDKMFPQALQAALVVEFDSDSLDNLRERANDLFARARASFGSLGGWTAFSQEERDLFRDLLRKSSCARMRMAPSFQPFPFWDDARVPVESIPDFLRELQDLFQRERVVYSVGGNIGFGQLSIAPILRYGDDDARRAFALSERFEDLVLSRGGEIGVARGNGRVRAASLAKRFPNLFPAFVRVKDAFDPKNLFNPDCVVSPEMRRLAELAPEQRRAETSVARKVPADSRRDDGDEFGDYLAPETDAALRESALHSRAIAPRPTFVPERLERYSKIDWLNRPKRSQLEYQIAWNPALIYKPALQCNGCGHCRIRTSETRMCPAFRNNPDEQASCRAKANLLRGALVGELSLDELTTNDAKKIAERCLRCHCCESECPAQVDVAALTFRLTSANRAANGSRFSELFATRLHRALSVASYFPNLATSALKNRFVRWTLEKTLGLAQGRALPQLEQRPVLSRIKREYASERTPSLETFRNANDAGDAPFIETSSKTRAKVALFLDDYANFFDATLVDAVVAILERGGASVKIPQKPVSTGAVAFALGDLDRSEEFAARAVSVFRELMRDGSEIVTLEPLSAVCIKKEYRYFNADDDAQLVYANTLDACSYVERLFQTNRLSRDDLRPLDASRTLRIGYHAPCRSIALSGESLYAPTAAFSLLSRIPNAETRRVERGCCGLSGYTGFFKRRFTESLRIGARLFVATRDSSLDLCSSECSFCNAQLAQGSDKPIAHSLKLLAVSLGALPLEKAFTKLISVPRR